jgi:hypothetical protein
VRRCCALYQEGRLVVKGLYCWVQLVSPALYGAFRPQLLQHLRKGCGAILLAGQPAVELNASAICFLGKHFRKAEEALHKAATRGAISVEGHHA